MNENNEIDQLFTGEGLVKTEPAELQANAGEKPTLFAEPVFNLGKFTVTNSL